MHDDFDLAAYFERIGYDGPKTARLETLCEIHRLHPQAIAFENLNPLLRWPVPLDARSLQQKLVTQRRGGYCYEHNTLFAGVLEALGFRVTRLAARVVVGADRIDSRPRTHMALLVEAPGDPQPYLADVGFGAIGALLEPVPLTAGVEFEDAGRRHRLAHAPHDGPLPLWLLQAHDRTKDEWADQYAFTLEPFEKPDFEVINWHIGTNPRSPFTRRVYVQSLSAERHLLLNGRLLAETRADGTVVEREVTGEAEARRLLDEEFGIDAPDGMTLLPPV